MTSQTKIAKASSLLISGTDVTRTNILDELPNNNSIAIVDNSDIASILQSHIAV